MIITIPLTGVDLKHMQPHQYGAFVAHVMALKDFYKVEVTSDAFEVSFHINGDKPEDFQANLRALEQLDPMPCPCGCAAYLAITPCFRQSERLTSHGLTQEEIDIACAGNKIGAIKAVRERTRVGLKEAKDMVDNYCHSLPTDHRAYYPHTVRPF